MRGQVKLFQGDIVVVKFPFTDLVNYKVRPAVVVSNASVNKGADVIIAPITTTIRNDIFSFHIDDSMLTTPIEIQGEIRCGNVATCEKKLAKKISSLKSGKNSELVQQILQSFQ